MIFDTHAHYDDEAFDEDRRELLLSMKENGVGLITNIGASMKSSRNTVELTQEYDFIYGAVGVHPEEVEKLTKEDMQQLREWAALDKIVAIGEIGLDYHYPEPSKEVQEKWFVNQLELARQVQLPVVIHSRDAAQDTVRIMQEHNAQEIGGVVHCFSYTKELAEIFLKMGFYIGIGGVCTFNNAKKLIEALEIIPLDRIVLETDCPYLSPTPERGTRNNSKKLHFVAEKLSELKGISKEEIIRITQENGKRMYRI